MPSRTSFDFFQELNDCLAQVPISGSWYVVGACLPPATRFALRWKVSLFRVQLHSRNMTRAECQIREEDRTRCPIPLRSDSRSRRNSSQRLCLRHHSQKSLPHLSVLCTSSGSASSVFNISIEHCLNSAPAQIQRTRGPAETRPVARTQS